MFSNNITRIIDKEFTKCVREGNREGIQQIIEVFILLGKLIGKLEGLQEGRLEGKQKSARNIAIRLLQKGMSSQEVADLTDLPPEQVLELMPKTI